MDDSKTYLKYLDLRSLWEGFSGSQREFAEYLKTLVHNPETVDYDLRYCDSCEYPCLDRTYVYDGSRVCDYCLEDDYSYCDYCAEYLPHDHSHGEDDDGDCGCESPARDFTVRNDGSDPLQSDTRLTVALPAGVISGEGMKAIRRYLSRKDDYGSRVVSYHVDSIGDAWQENSGNFTKRLSRYAYKEHGIKLTPEVLSEVGNIARAHSNETSVSIEVTRYLNMSAEDFYHEDSCWWGSYSESRCALKSNGGFGIRSFSSDSGGYVNGRAWVMPLRLSEHGDLRPTFDTEAPDALIVFNGYGELSGYAPARVLAHMYGWTYRKIGFNCEPMYINAGGYLIAPESIADRYTGGRLDMTVSQHSGLYASERRNYSEAA